MRPQPCVILVERDAALRSALAFSLGLEGYQVRAFEGADAVGLERAFAETSCLVLDHDPADHAGHGLLRRVANDGAGERTVVLATNPCRALRDRLARAGVKLVEKPLMGDGLSDALRILCATAKAG